MKKIKNVWTVVKKFLGSDLFDDICMYANACVLGFVTTFYFCIGEYHAAQGWFFALVWFLLYVMMRDSQQMWRKLAKEILDSWGKSIERMTASIKSEEIKKD